MKKSMIIRKPIFFKMFIKRFLIFALAAVIVGVVGTKVASYFYGMYMASEIWNVGDDLFGEILSEYDDIGDRERFENGVSYASNFYSQGSRMFVLVDNRTGEVAAKPSADTLYLTTYSESEEDSRDMKMVIYTCESAEIVNAIRESQAEIGNNKGILYVSMDDLYLKGRTFIPGKTAIRTYGVEEDNVLAQMDFTPEDTTGYRHVTVGYDVEFAYEIPSYFDISLTPEVIRCMEEAVENLNEWDLYMSSTGAYNDVGAIGYNTCYFDSVFEMGVDMGEGYTLLGICHYNFFREWLWECMISYIALVVVALALAFITANVSYMNQKNFYEMNEYRKGITNTMAHDLKSPLMIISGYAENLMDQDLSEKAQHFTKGIMENTEYMNRLIEKSLELSKVESGKIKPYRENLDLREMSQELAESYQSKLEERGLEITVCGECTVNADRISMREVLDNLIGNAVKYASEGTEIKICLSDKAYKVSNVSETEFDMDVKELVKPFVKGDNSRTGKKGSGIGLTIAENLCRQHGFELKLECRDGVFTAKVDL